VNDSIARISRNFGYQFNNTSLLEQALTHRSSGKNNNERLEYLGDAILGFVIAELLYKKFPTASEGVLTRLRATLVRKETLAKLSKEMELGQFILLGSGEKKSGGWRRDSILANTLEALIGAMYLDSGHDTCRKYISELYQEQLADLSQDELAKDPKTELQEYLQAQKKTLPVYQVITENGEAHARTFTVECQIDGLDSVFVADGKSKRSAEQSAAKKALDLLLPEDK